MKKKDTRKKKNRDTEEIFPKRRRSTVLKNVNISESYYNFPRWSQTIQQDLKKAVPFPYWQFENFIDNSSQIVEDIENELQNFPNWHRKENDLYSLYQTDDFKSLDVAENPALFSLRQFLYGTVKDWLSQVTGVELLPQVDVNGSCYAHTDGLLPHNDLIETRRFAFVYYVTPFVWMKANGGQLNLYNSDEHDQPTSVAVQLTPRRNSLLIFEVSHKSWHRVSEILGTDDPRLSVNGWFHSSRRLEAKSPFLVESVKFRQNAASEKPNCFINSTYLDGSKITLIQEAFGENSEVSLKEFLMVSLAEKILTELERGKFDEIGPPSKRKLLCGKLETFGVNSKRLSAFLLSSVMSKFCSSVTGCFLKDCFVSLIVGKIEKGTYSVVGDEDVEKAIKEGYMLDVHLFLGSGTWLDKAGGETVYIGKEDEEALIRVNPSPNTLALVLRDPEVSSFQKYANSCTKGSFFQITLRYHNVQVDDEDEEAQ